MQRHHEAPASLPRRDDGRRHRRTRCSSGSRAGSCRSMPCPPTALTVSFVDLPRREVPDGLPPCSDRGTSSCTPARGPRSALRAATDEPVEVGFRPDDPDLGGRVMLDFSRSSTGSRRTSRSSGTPTTRTSGSTSCAATGTSWSSSDGTVLADSRRRAWRSSRPSCPPAGTSPRRRADGPARALGHAHRVRLQGAGELPQRRPRRRAPTSPGSTPSRSMTHVPVRDLVAFWSERSVRDRGRRPGPRRHARRGAPASHSDDACTDRPRRRPAGPCAYIRGDPPRTRGLPCPPCPTATSRSTTRTAAAPADPSSSSTAGRSAAPRGPT